MYLSGNKTGFSVKFLALVPVFLLSVIACSTETRQLFFDIQPPTTEELAEQARKKAAAESAANPQSKNKKPEIASLLFPQFSDEDLPPPAIEEVMDWEKVEESLPKDNEDNVDWSEALRQGLIRPRTGSDPRTILMTTFQWDFIIPAAVDEDEDEDEDEDKDEDEDEDEDEDDEEEGEGHEDDAYFPHSAHTQWLSCKNCHMTIYPLRRNPATMKEMKKGKSCGVCHGRDKVAFSLKACDRCHLNSE